jgi:iron complex transport system substrate-binding protein
MAAQWTRRGLIAASALAAPLAACGQGATSGGSADETLGNPVPLSHARTFRIFRNDGYAVVDFEAQMSSWGGGAQGPVQRRRVVVIPPGGSPPELTGPLSGASVVRAPAGRIACNYAPQEAMLTALGVEDRIVAVGGVKSYNDRIRERARSGELRQIGYGWHKSPELDAVVASRPDVFCMAMMDPAHAEHMERAQAMGVAVTPFFIDAEPHYLGKVEYIRLMGLLTGLEREAETFFNDVRARVEALKITAAALPRRKVLAASWAGGDVWMATVRNSDAALWRDANVDLVLGQPDDPLRDSSQRLGTERLIAEAAEAEFWVARDGISAPYPDRSVLRHIRAFRDGQVYALDGRIKDEADAYDIFEMGVLRPDWLLGDVVKMIHPDAVQRPFEFLRPDARTLGS